MLKASAKKQTIYLSILITLVVLTASYFLITASHTPHIQYMFEAANGNDTVYCTLENYQRSPKSGPSYSGILFRSFDIAKGKEIIHEELSFSSYGIEDKFLGYKNGYAWFIRKEKPVMIYVFKKDSILEEAAAINLLSTMNPGKEFAFMNYAPTQGVMYVNIKNGDQFVIDPFTLRYVPVTTELESYRYGLKPINPINDANELEVNENVIIELNQESDSDLAQCLVKKTYALKHGLFDSLISMAYLTRTKFINAKLALFQKPVLFIQHTDVYGSEAKHMISAFNILSNTLLWTIPLQSKPEALVQPKLYSSLNPNRFYSISDNEEPIRLSIVTGEVLQ